jgi:hypothetical protein
MTNHQKFYITQHLNSFWYIIPFDKIEEWDQWLKEENDINKIPLFAQKIKETECFMFDDITLKTIN